VQLRFVSLILAVAGVCGLAATAAKASPIVGGGLATSIACPDGSSPCSTSANFSLSPPTPVKPATGSITFGAGTATILLNVASYTMTGSSGSVTALDFSNVSYSATVPITSTPLGGGLVQISQSLGFASGSVSGTYDQIGGPGSGPFSDLTASFSNLSCLLQNGIGQCGFNVGSFNSTADFGLDVNGAQHDVVQTFNVIVPEPGSVGLFVLGGLGLAAYARRRSRQS
jgi:hypothetical protein